MGQQSCTSCCTTQLENEFRSSVIVDSTSKNFPEGLATYLTTEAISVDLGKQEQTLAETIARLWAGYQARKVTCLMRKHGVCEGKYFSSAEIKETLRDVPLAKSRVHKATFQYKSGAKYTGEWLGGFRDGYGVIEWPDGSVYEGSWSFSRPYGNGCFNMSDGNVYEGYWGNPYISGSESICKTGSGWEYDVTDGFCKL